MTIDPEILTLILAFLAGAAAIGLGVWLARRSNPSSDNLAGVLKDFDQRTQELTGRLAQLSEDSRKSQSELSRAIQDRLDKVSARMGQSLEQSATKTAKSVGDIQARLEVIDKAQRNITELSGEIVGLQNILSNKQARGAFGEVQLKDLVSSILPPQAYKFQATLSNKRVADCLIHLPNPPGPIAVDAKFPLESFHGLRQAGDGAEKERAGKAFAADILRHVTDIAERYPNSKYAVASEARAKQITAFKKYKKLKHTKYPGFELWKAVLKRDKEAWKEMDTYAIHDVLSTEEHYELVKGWIKIPPMAAFIDDEIMR